MVIDHQLCVNMSILTNTKFAFICVVLRDKSSLELYKITGMSMDFFHRIVYGLILL